jgi:2-hydroxychromene-2-carboxylate isomerase
MAAKVIDYYVTMSSPWAFLGHAPFIAMAEKHGARVNHKPFGIREVFAVSGGLVLQQRSPQRRAYRQVELIRWSRLRGVPLIPNPTHFPSDPTAANLMLLAAQRDDLEPAKLAEAIMTAQWVEDRDISDLDTLDSIARRCGLDNVHLMAAIQQPETVGALEALTDEAKMRRVFGAPTYFYRDEPFWGQDRLDFLERALNGQTAPVTMPREA